MTVQKTYNRVPMDYSRGPIILAVISLSSGMTGDQKDTEDREEREMDSTLRLVACRMFVSEGESDYLQYYNDKFKSLNCFHTGHFIYYACIFLYVRTLSLER